MAAVMQIDKKSNDDARATLTAALDRRLAAEVALERSSEAVKQAHAAVVAVESHLSQFDDLDNRIAAARAEMVKRGDAGKLPGSLAADREARRAAREDLDECRSALALLEAQLSDAEKARRETAEAHSGAAMDVMLDEAEALANELHAAHRIMWHLADSLSALDYVVMGASAPLPPEVKGRLQGRLARLLLPLQTVHAQRQALPAAAPNNPVHLQGEKWQAVYVELKYDPQAQVRLVWDS